MLLFFFFFKQKTAYEMRISDWSSDVCSSDLEALSKLTAGRTRAVVNNHQVMTGEFTRNPDLAFPGGEMERLIAEAAGPGRADFLDATRIATALLGDSIATNLFMLGYAWQRSEEHTSELQSLMRISYAVFCLKKKKT